MAVTTFNPNPRYFARPFSRYEGRKISGYSDNRLVALTLQDMPFDYYSMVDDFLQGTMDATLWAVSHLGAAATDFAYNAQRGGALRGITGTDNPGAVEVHGNAVWQSDDNPYFGVQLVMPATVTNLQFEIGFANVLSTKVTPGYSAVGTPVAANGLTDGAAVVIKTSDATATVRLLGVGTSTAAAGTTIVTTLGGSTGYTPTLSKIIEVHIGVGIAGAWCSIWDSGAQVGQQIFSVASGPDTAVLMFPYIQFRALSATSKTVDVLKCVLAAEENRTS